jgi:RNA polymerase sigma-70 factor (ECF subfamily)
MDPSKIEHLVKKARNGDDSAYGALVEALHRPVFYVALSVICDHELAEDITQETFVKAYATLGDLRDDTRFVPWLKTIARNRALSLYRKLSRRPEVIGQPPDDIVADETIADLGAAEQTERLRQELLRRIEILPETQRRLLFMKYVDRMPVEDIAAIENMSGAAVRNHLYRARKLLRGMLGNE